MIVEAQVTINGSKAAIWAVITNIANASETISGIENIEVLEKPANGLVGLRWRETRMLFGKPATVEKWITDAADNAFYRTRAESDGFVFLNIENSHIYQYSNVPFVEHHRDPFDRLLLATAFVEHATILSNDRNFKLYNTLVESLW